MTIQNNEVTETFLEAQAMPVSDTDRGAGPEDDYDDEGYDETQRAEILEVESTGPTDGAIQTDLRPDLGGGDADDDEIEDDEDALGATVDTDADFTGGVSVLGDDEDQGSERLISEEDEDTAEDDDEDFDVDDEDGPDNAPGQIGA